MSKTIDAQVEAVDKSLREISETVGFPNEQLTTSITESSKLMKDQVGLSSSDVIGAISENAQDISSSVSGLNTSLSVDLHKMTTVLSDAVYAVSRVIESASDGVSLKTALFTIMMALVGSGAAFLFNWLHWKMAQKKENLGTVSKAFSASVKKLNEDASTYWLKNCSAKYNNEDHLLEMRIQSLLRECREYARILVSLLNKKNHKDEISGVDTFTDGIFDLVTGGDFEVLGRTVNKNKAVKINRMCSKVTMQLAKITFVD